MLDKIDLKKVLFLDIETVPLHSNYEQLGEAEKELWNHKAQFLSREDDTPSAIYQKAGIYAEFGKIVCISVGFFADVEKPNFRVKSFYGDDEKALLMEFIQLLNENYRYKDQLLCAHNGKEFDFPYIARRILINQLELPHILNLAGKKPWEVQHLDTMELWKFGDYKHYTSLILLTHVFNIPTPKDDISGADVWKVYWEEKDLHRIVNYCQKDVITIAQLILRFLRKELLKEEDITFA